MNEVAKEFSSENSSTQHSIQRPPLTVFAAALVALATLYVTTRNWIIVPVALTMIAALFIKTRLESDGSLVRLGRYAIFGLLLWQSYGYFTSPGSDSLEMVLAYTIGYLCAVEMAIQMWLRRPASGARSPAIILLSAMVFLAASNTLDQSYIRFFTPLYFLFLSLSWRAFAPTIFHSKTFWKRGFLLAGVLGLSALVHGGVWHFRQEISNWGMKFLEGRSVESSGLSTDATLGSRFNLRGSTTRMLLVKNISGNEDALYLRVAAFADYQNNRWFPILNRQAGRILSIDQLKPAPDSLPLRARPLRITRLNDDQQLVFSPLQGAGFAFPANSLPQWGPPLGPLQATSTDGTPGLIYDVFLSQKENYQGYYCTPPNAKWLARYRDVPNDIDARVKSLARTIGSGAKNDEERVRAVENYLLKNHHYSLESSFGSGDHVSEFLLKKRDAHCEFFASGGVILLRCLGVPSRYVIGYVAHEPDGDDAAVVRGRDAHAWIECWIGNQWITADFTPGGGRPEGRAEPLPLKVKLSEWFQKAGDSLRAKIEDLRKMPLRNWLFIFAGLILILLWSARHPRRKKVRREAFSYAARDAQLARLAARFEKWLRKRNAPCPPGLTWPEHLRRAGLENAQTFAARYDTARFGNLAGGLGNEESLNELQNLLHELERES